MCRRPVDDEGAFELMPGLPQGPEQGHGQTTHADNRPWQDADGTVREVGRAGGEAAYLGHGLRRRCGDVPGLPPVRVLVAVDEGGDEPGHIEVDGPGVRHVSAAEG